MRATLGIITAITLGILAYTLRQPTLDALFSRDQPATPDGHQPKYRSCHHGEWTEGPWA